MVRYFSWRRAFVAALAVCLLGSIVLAVASQAIAARRPWGVRRLGNRAPAAPRQTAPAAPGRKNEPAPIIPTPVPDPLTAYGIPSLESTCEGPDEATVRREIVEIHRRLRSDPAFRIFEDEDDEELIITRKGELRTVPFRPAHGEDDVIIAAAWNHERTSESAFQRALESLGSVETSTTIAALRGAARVLDAKANDCEDAEAFDRADELRELAKKLREEARRAE